MIKAKCKMTQLYECSINNEMKVSCLYKIYYHKVIKVSNVSVSSADLRFHCLKT